MIKMNLYFDEVAVDTVHASSMKEAFDMIDKLEGFYDQNECCIDYWFKELKRFYVPSSVRLQFDLSDKETKCWFIFDMITEAYSYNYDIIDNTIIFDACIANTLNGMKKIGHNDVMTGHFEYPTIEQALIEWLDTLKETNAVDEETENTPTWDLSIIEFIESLIVKRNQIELKDVEDLNEELKQKECSFKLKFSEHIGYSNTASVVPISNVFIDSTTINLNNAGHEYIENFFKKRGITLSYNNARDIFWAKN